MSKACRPIWCDDVNIWWCGCHQKTIRINNVSAVYLFIYIHFYKSIVVWACLFDWPPANNRAADTNIALYTYGAKLIDLITNSSLLGSFSVLIGAQRQKPPNKQGTHTRCWFNNRIYTVAPSGFMIYDLWSICKYMQIRKILFAVCDCDWLCKLKLNSHHERPYW